jgi:hypothetical protein
MKKVVTDSKKLKQIDEIHSSLYSFSICKLDYLNSYESFSFLLDYFIDNYKDKVMKGNPTMAKAKTDFTQGFEYL